MTLFWLAVAAMVVAALAAVLPALLGGGRRDTLARQEVNLAVHRDRMAEVDRQAAVGELDPEQAVQARREVEHELLQDVREVSDGEGPAPTAWGHRWVAGVVALALPLVAVLTYLELGTPEASRVQASAPATPQAEAHATASVDQLVGKLVRRLESNPADADGWLLLGRSYVALNRYGEARDAFEAAARLTPENPEVLTRLAEAAALAAGGDLRGEPEAALQRALALRPDYPNALWLAGLAASQGGRYAEAVGHWESLLALAQDPEDRAMISQHLEEVKREAGVAPIAGGVPGEAAEAPAATPAPGPQSPALSVAVSLAPDLQDRVSAADTVFVFARPAEGSRMPLAIVRTTAGQLPTTVVLDDRAVMNPGTKLSTVPRIVVGARVSKSGTAMPQPGDLEGLSAPLSPAEVSSVAVTIDTPR